MATQRPDAAASANYDSKGRWIALAVLLVCVFLLAAVGGYLLQRDGSDSSQDDLVSIEPLPDTTEDGGAPVDSLSTAEDTASADTTAGAGNRGGTPGTGTAHEAVGGSGAAETSGPKTAASPPAVTPKRVPEPVRAQPKQGLQESVTTPPPAVPPPAVPPPATPAPAIPSRANAAPAAQTPPETPASPATTSAPDATIVAEGETFGGATPARRAPPNTRVLKPDGQAPAANLAAPPTAQLGLKPAPPAAPPVEEGILYWTGRLRKNQVITIEAGRASVGQIEGKLPGIPVDVWLPSPAVVLAERPNPDNNWGRVAFRCVRDTDRNVTINVQWKRLR